MKLKKRVYNPYKIDVKINKSNTVINIYQFMRNKEN